ncbi:aryl-sulfate sulfotransferase [Tundrisphaera lichenicola]|uniref:aryl-sulfate sulfotransferase n=1 Tax=Tundrisphaera lichenicola TaxID=2029860 RepID=UPI003EB8B43F
MWHPPSAISRQVNPRQAPARRSRIYRPRCKPLEVRCLLSVTLSDSGPAVPSVGSPVVWTATTDGHGATPVYQFRVQSAGTSRVVRDFSTSNSFTWNPMQEGSYEIQVTVKNGFVATTGESASASYEATSLVLGSVATISGTPNPLVALYSAPPTSGSSMYVEFSPMGPNPSWQSTSPLAIVPGKSTNFLVAGLLPNTTYLMRHVQDNGTISAPLTFQTGSLPTNVTFPTFAVEQAPTPEVDPTQDLVFHVGIATQPNTIGTLATDRAGNIVWYYDSVANDFLNYAPRLVPGGTVLMLGGDAILTGGYTGSLREVDLAGNTLRETNTGAINAELASLGQHPITNIHHEAQRLPNGDTAILGTSPRTVNLNGTPTEYNGDMVIVLDQNFQVTWVWDPFTHLDTNRLPTLGEGPIDWMHTNAVAWSPADGDLLVSMRSQDWVIKIDYANGAGDGHVVWRLGQGGDFTINSSDPSPWFTHQHDAHYINDTTVMLFDNGNTRQSTDPEAHSRGQVLVLDEKTMQATLKVNADLGEYAGALGSAQLLPNGSLDFTSGFTQRTIEVLPDGTQTYVLKMNLTGVEYRSYIYDTLYGYSVAYNKSEALPTSDLSVFRPSTGTWYDATIGGVIVTNAQQWGLPGDIPVPGDYDGDGKDDLAVFRPSNGKWYVYTATGQVLLFGQQWGLTGDIPSTGDFDGDGKDDLAVFRPSISSWYIYTTTGQVLMYGQQWGLAGDKPEVGDFDGDGQADLAVLRPSNGNWYIRTVDGQILVNGARWGLSEDIPIPGDFNGDGKDDLAVFRPSNSQWYIQSITGPVIAYGQQWGLTGDIPSTGDFSGDGKADLAVFRPSNGKWYIAGVGGPVITYGRQWGLTGDIPTTATAVQKAQLASSTSPTAPKGSKKAGAASTQVSIPLQTTTTPALRSSANQKKRSNPRVVVTTGL